MITKIVAIVAISAISIFFRWVAFNRVDSVAMELSVVSFSARVLESIAKYQVGELTGTDIILCVSSLALVMILSFVHHSLYSSLLERIKEIVNNAKPGMESDAEENEEERAKNEIKRQALDNTLPLARHAIFLSYSYFLEHKFNFYIRRGKKNARENYAKLINSLSKLSYTTQASDLLLPPGTQKGGLVVFSLLGVVSVFLATL